MEIDQFKPILKTLIETYGIEAVKTMVDSIDQGLVHEIVNYPVTVLTQPTESEVRHNNHQLREFYRPLWDQMWYEWLKDKDSVDAARITTFVNQGWRPLGHIGTEDLGMTFPSEQEVSDYVSLVVNHIRNYNAPI